MVKDCDLLLEEYRVLKAEQLQRIGTRDNLLYATMAALGLVVGAAASNHNPAFLLLIPPVCLVLGWTYHANDSKITAIGQYVRTELAPELARLTGSEKPEFRWEGVHRAGVFRVPGQLAADLTAFGVPPIAAMVAYWLTRPGSALLLAVSAVEVAAALLLSARIAWCAAGRRAAPAEQPGLTVSPGREASGVA